MTLVDLKKIFNTMNDNFSAYATEWVQVLSIKYEILQNIESSVSRPISALGESLMASFLFFYSISTTHLWQVNQTPVFPSYRNQSIDLLCKSINWFLYEGKTGVFIYADDSYLFF